MWEKPQKLSHLSFQKLTESWKNRVCNNKNNREWLFVPFVTIFGQNGQTVDNYILKSKTSYFCYFYCKILRWFIGQKSSKAPSKHSTDHRAVTTQIISAITIVKIQFGQNIDLERFEKNKSKNRFVIWFENSKEWKLQFQNIIQVAIIDFPTKLVGFLSARRSRSIDCQISFKCTCGPRCHLGKRVRVLKVRPTTLCIIRETREENWTWACAAIDAQIMLQHRTALALA